MDDRYNVYNIEPEFRKFLHAENISADTLKNYLSDLRHFLGWIVQNGRPLTNLDSIVKEHILSYKSYLSANNVSVITINRSLSTLRKFFQFLIKSNLTHQNPAREVPNIKIESKLNVIKKHFSKNKIENKTDEILSKKTLYTSFIN